MIEYVSIVPCKKEFKKIMIVYINPDLLNYKIKIERVDYNLV